MAHAPLPLPSNPSRWEQNIRRRFRQRAALPVVFDAIYNHPDGAGAWHTLDGQRAIVRAFDWPYLGESYRRPAIEQVMKEVGEAESELSEELIAAYFEKSPPVAGKSFTVFYIFRRIVFCCCCWWWWWSCWWVFTRLAVGWIFVVRFSSDCGDRD